MWKEQKEIQRIDEKIREEIDGSVAEGSNMRPRIGEGIDEGVSERVSRN